MSHTIYYVFHVFTVVHTHEESGNPTTRSFWIDCVIPKLYFCPKIPCTALTGNLIFVPSHDPFLSIKSGNSLNSIREKFEIICCGFLISNLIGVRSFLIKWGLQHRLLCGMEVKWGHSRGEIDGMNIAEGVYCNHGVVMERCWGFGGDILESQNGWSCV